MVSAVGFFFSHRVLLTGCMNDRKIALAHHANDVEKCAKRIWVKHWFVYITEILDLASAIL